MMVGIGTAVLMFGVGWPQVEAEDLLLKDVSRSHGYGYNSNGRRDPFRTLEKPIKSTLFTGSTVSTDTFPMIHWSLLGIMSGVTGHHAMLQNSNGGRYLVSLGDILTDENVRVVRLTNTTVTLEMLIKNTEGLPKDKKQPQFLDLTFTNGR